jgi:uncharacterized protein (DUF849 family)
VNVQACLNGGLTRTDHPGVPLTPAELAAAAVASRDAGAFCVHLHPRDADGVQSLKPRDCDAAVAAIRRAAPRLPIGLSSSELIDRDPFARAAAIKSWKTPPDFISVNVWELGWGGIARAASQAGIQIEAGLSTPADAKELSSGPFAHRVLRALVEVAGGADDARAVAALIPAGVSQLWHGYGNLTWEVISAAISAGVDVRVGLEDVTTLADGRAADGNADLVAAAVQLAA